MHRLETDFSFEMDDNFGLCGGQNLSCPSTATSFSSASSVYDHPFTPTSRRSTPNSLTLDFSHEPMYEMPDHHGMVLTPTSPGYMFGEAIKQEPEHLSFHTEPVLPSTPMKKMDTPFSFEPLLDMGAPITQMSNIISPSHSFGMTNMSPVGHSMAPASYMMTPTRSLSTSSESANPNAWPMAQESPISFFPMASTELERHSQSPINNMGHHYSLQSNASPSNRLRIQRKMDLHEAQRKSSELHRAQSRSTRTRPGKTDVGAAVTGRANCKCDHPGCNKAYRRNEHLKRHKLTHHGEGRTYPCEFCGKDKFNREDNLNNHRKLHARPNGRNRGVEFIPAAVAIIEAEERNRKRRAPPKSKMATEKRHQVC